MDARPNHDMNTDAGMNLPRLDLYESRRDHNIREHNSHPTLAFLTLMILLVLLLLIVIVRARACGVLGVVLVRLSTYGVVLCEPAPMRPCIPTTGADSQPTDVIIVQRQPLSAVGRQSPFHKVIQHLTPVQTRQSLYDSKRSVAGLEDSADTTLFNAVKEFEKGFARSKTGLRAI
jgi:hypothetical protein